MGNDAILLRKALILPGLCRRRVQVDGYTPDTWNLLDMGRSEPKNPNRASSYHIGLVMKFYIFRFQA